MERHAKRTVLTALVLAAVLAASSVWLYGRVYALDADNSGFAQAAEAYLGRGSAFPSVYRVEDAEASLDLGSRRYVLAELGDGGDLSLGLFRLERGLNGRYRITGAEWGGGSFRRRVVREDGRACFLLGGRNSVLGLAAASFTMGDDDHAPRTYRLEIPAGDYFLTALEIDPGFSAEHEEPGSLRLYDGAGEDVTERANL